MKDTKTLKLPKILIGACVIAVLFGACSTKDDITALPQTSERMATRVVYDYEKILNMTNYVHWYEGSVPKGYCAALKTKGCAPAAYIMTRRLVNSSFPVNVDEYKKAIDGMSTSCTGGTYFNKIGEYAKRTDQFGSKHVSYSAFNREDCKTYLKGLLTANKPAIVAVWVKGTTITDVTKTSDGKPSGEGHVVGIYGLQLTKDGTGSTVYYIDPLSPTDGRKSIDYTVLLNSMSVFGSYYIQPVGFVTK